MGTFKILVFDGKISEEVDKKEYTEYLVDKNKYVLHLVDGNEYP